MAKAPGYLMVGKGRWGARMQQMLAGDGRHADFVSGSRKLQGEADGEFEARMAAAFRGSGAQIVWLCVTPGPYVPLLIRAAIAARMNVLVEKPWVYSREVTEGLQQAARHAGLQTAVHFEFCMLAEVEKWRGEFGDREELAFGGIFDVSAADRSRIPVMQNLGSHLVAMQEYAVPRTSISTIDCHYQAVDQRRIFLDGGEGRVGEIDFLRTKEPIIQRFLELFEGSLGGGRFLFDFDFGWRVHETLGRFS